MHIDKITLQDISFYGKEHSVFSILKAECTTKEGEKVLQRHILNPPNNREKVLAFQDAVSFWIKNQNLWGVGISNGTLVMLHDFFKTTDHAILKPGRFQLFLMHIKERFFKKKTHSFELFSMSHISDFLKDCQSLSSISDDFVPEYIKSALQHIRKDLEHPLIREILNTDEQTTTKEWLLLAYETKRQIKPAISRLIDQYAKLDAVHALASATVKNNWVIPEILSAQNLVFKTTELTHPLIKNPVGFDLDLNDEKRFLFLTGTNMSGKSSLLYAMGIAVLLAHLGCGVPAREMTISFLNGLITNMHIEDNILLGESYFFAEVQRMKVIAQKIREQPYQLVLMDELFKGTNGEDAYDCTHAVVEGLLERKENLMALSTHIVELAASLDKHPEIVFKFFETKVDKKGHYSFSYQLKEGVSDNRIGFLVLKKEGVLDLLKD